MPSKSHHHHPFWSKKKVETSSISQEILYSFFNDSPDRKGRPDKQRYLLSSKQSLDGYPYHLSLVDWLFCAHWWRCWNFCWCAPRGHLSFCVPPKSYKENFYATSSYVLSSTIHTWLNPSFFLKECKLVFEYPNQPLVERKELHFGPLCNWRVGSRHWCFHTWNTLPGWNRGVMPLRSGKRIAHFGIHCLQLSIQLKWEKSRAFLEAMFYNIFLVSSGSAAAAVFEKLPVKKKKQHSSTKEILWHIKYSPRLIQPQLISTHFLWNKIFQFYPEISIGDTKCVP